MLGVLNKNIAETICQSKSVDYVAGMYIVVFKCDELAVFLGNCHCYSLDFGVIIQTILSKLTTNA